MRPPRRSITERRIHIRNSLRHGALSGLAGGAALAAVLLLGGESSLQRAIDLEPAGGQELFTRSGQRLGGVLAALLVGVALGLVFAVVATAVRQRQEVLEGKAADPWGVSLQLAALAFVTFQLVPFLKYPPNPPGIGTSESVGRRTVLYVALLAWSAVAAWAGWRARRWLDGRRVPRHIAGPSAVLTALALILFALVALPGGPSPDVVPASVVWSFRLASLGGWAAYWAVVGTVYGWLSTPADLRPFDHPSPAPSDRVPSPD